VHFSRITPVEDFEKDNFRMARTPSTMVPLGTQAPNFQLLNVDGQTVGLDDFAGAPAYLIIFMCNHCPFVKHIAPGLADLAREYQARGAAVIAISSNDASKYPADSPEQMVHEVENQNYSFPYLYDETQEVAKAYRAACTPDFYVFDKNKKLVYRGQMDDSRPDSGIPVTGRDLRMALDTVLAGKEVSEQQRPSIGCNIKWKPGNEPDYYGHMKA
jgi:peroxiredoxin